MLLTRSTPHQHAHTAAHSQADSHNVLGQVKALQPGNSGFLTPRQQTRGCSSTVIGRCQQGTGVSAAAAQPGSHGGQLLPANSNVHEPVLQHNRHLTQAVSTQQAVLGFPPALDLQQPQQCVQQQLHRSQHDCVHVDTWNWLDRQEHVCRGQASVLEQQQPQQQPQQQSQLGHCHQNGQVDPAAGAPESCYNTGAAVHQNQTCKDAVGVRLQQQQQQQHEGTADRQQQAHETACRQLQHLQAMHQQQHQQSIQHAIASTPGPEHQQRQPKQGAMSPLVTQPLDPQQHVHRQQHQLRPAQITSRIKALQTLQQLQDLYQQHSSSFNAINLAALLSRLAHIHRRNTGAPTVAAGLQQFCTKLMHELIARLSECTNARQVSNAMWALAVLQCQPPKSLLQATAQHLTAEQPHLLQASAPQDLANLAWGLAKLRHDPTCSIWRCLVASISKRLPGCKPGELAMLLWALADVQQRRPLHCTPKKQLWATQRQQQQASKDDADGAGTDVCQLSEAEPHAQHRQWAERRQSNAQTSTSLAVLCAPAQDHTQPNKAGSLQQRRLAHVPLMQPGPRQVPVQANAAARRAAAAKASWRHKKSFQPHAASSTCSTQGERSSSSTGASDKDSKEDFGLQQLLPTLAQHVQQQLAQGQQQYKAREVAMLLRACAVLGLKHEGLVTALAHRQHQHMQEGRCNSQDVANSVWALAKLEAVQPQLLAAAATQQTSWLQHCSCHELSLVLYGSAFVLRQQRHLPACSDLVPAATLWNVAAARILDEAPFLVIGPAEAATLAQAAAMLLQPVRQRGIWQPLRQQQQQQTSHVQSTTASSSSRLHRPVVTAAADGIVTADGCVADSSDASCSCTSMDSWEEAVGTLPAQARQLLAAVDAALSQSAGDVEGPQGIPHKYVVPVLHSWAAAGVQPSAHLQGLLLHAAASAAPGMRQQELAMTAWAAAKLFGDGRHAASVQVVMEAVDQAAGPLLASMSPLQLAMLAWAHGRLWRLGDSLFMHQLAQAATHQVPHFGPQAISNLTWAFARMRHYDAALTAAVSRRTRSLLSQFTAAELTNLTWALVTLRHRQAGLLRAVANHAAAACSSWDAKACVKLATTFCSPGMPCHKYRSLLSSLADSLADKASKAWSRLTPHELSQLAVAMAVARIRNRACITQLASAAVSKLPRMALGDVVLLVWALTLLGQRHDALLEAVSGRLAADLRDPQAQQQANNQVQPHKQDQPQPAEGSVASQQQDCNSLTLNPASVPGTPAVRAALQQLLDQAQVHSPLLTAAISAAAGGMELQQGPVTSSSRLSATPIYAVLGSRLRQHQLARLAWSYKTLAHADAKWYLAAGQLLAAGWPAALSTASSNRQSSNGCSSSCDEGVLTHDCSSASPVTCDVPDAGSSRSSTSTDTHDGARRLAAAHTAVSHRLQRPVHRPVL